ncbi:MAG: hypothetical protein LUO82_05750 [Methanomicrobiales archaeon]|nr:hypothetical protein [Methanomicrobiales archaeon]
MAAATVQDVNKNFIVFLQLVDIAVAAHSRGDSEVRDYALEELQDIIKSYRLKSVLNVLGNHM